MNDQQKERFLVLVERLQGQTSGRSFADRIGVPPGTLASWRKKPVGTKSMLAIVDYISKHYGKRNLDDLQGYLKGKISLETFLDPLYGLHETLKQFDIQTVRTWVKNRASLENKILLLNDLGKQVGGIAKANSSFIRSESIQADFKDKDSKDESRKLVKVTSPLTQVASDNQ